MTSGQALLATLSESLSVSPQILNRHLGGPLSSGSPCVGSANAQSTGAAALTHRHAPCTCGPSPRTRWQQPWRAYTHTPPSPSQPLAHEHSMHTHTHTHTRQEPGSRRDLGERWGGGLGLQLWPPPATSKPPAATPRMELCNWVENCKRNANWKQTQTHAQVNLKPIAHTPTPPKLHHVLRL